ncbi:hypothetical protein CLF_100322 [Clonorchis sinensis]|uniref:Transposable element Tc3 transposase n=1 Tax=Clonorchis sinensis TaxID=79923 RepID=G7Y371_CLOSI|nr:hypothetical protein CLF_100322 [Clonorchis sinensis]
MRRHLHLCQYYFTLLQNITEEDKEQRVTFANWLLDNEEIVPNILWSDEANFSVDSIINKHNCVIWSREAPHEYISHNLHSPHLCVWMGFSSKCLLRPFFFDATVFGDSYLHKLQTHVIPQLKQHKTSSTVFQQDGAPPHYSNQVRTYLREKFSDERVIARGFPNLWSARNYVDESGFRESLHQQAHYRYLLVRGRSFRQPTVKTNERFLSGSTCTAHSIRGHERDLNSLFLDTTGHFLRVYTEGAHAAWRKTNVRERPSVPLVPSTNPNTNALSPVFELPTQSRSEISVIVIDSMECGVHNQELSE